MSLKLLTHAEQVAAHLKAELLNGRWRNVLPGVHNLSKHLGVNHNTIHAALKLLEDEGIVSGQGRGRPRQITLQKQTIRKKSIRVKILCYEWHDRGRTHVAELLARLQGEGLAADYATKSLQDLNMNPKSVASFVEAHPADAWIVIAGNREILEWFANGPVPALAIFGRFTGIDIAACAPLKGPILVSVIRRLVAAGHQRIVMLARKERRLPYPGPFEQQFIDELENQGLRAGKYNLPDWDENPAGLRACLDSLFMHTPPTALIVSETAVFVATDRYLSQRGIAVPGKVSMLCTDYNPVFSWQEPQAAHIASDLRPVVNQAIRWATNVARGKEDRSQKTYKAKLVEGGTMGPAPGSLVSR